MRGGDTTFIVEEMKRGKDWFAGVGVHNALDEIDKGMFVVVEKGAESYPTRLKQKFVHVWTNVKVLGKLLLALLRKRVEEFFRRGVRNTSHRLLGG